MIPSTVSSDKHWKHHPTQRQSVAMAQTVNVKGKTMIYDTQWRVPRWYVARAITNFKNTHGLCHLRSLKTCVCRQEGAALDNARLCRDRFIGNFATTERIVSSLCNVKVVVFLSFVGVCTTDSELSSISSSPPCYWNPMTANNLFILRHFDSNSPFRYDRWIMQDGSRWGNLFIYDICDWTQHRN